MSAQRVVRLYFHPPANPCGEGATCCGPIGMTEEGVATLVSGLSTRLPGVTIERVDASRKLHLHRDGPVLRMVNMLGLAVYPVVTVGGDIVSMGPPAVDELAGIIRSKLTQAPRPAP